MDQQSHSEHARDQDQILCRCIALSGVILSGLMYHLELNSSLYNRLNLFFTAAESIEKFIKCWRLYKNTVVRNQSAFFCSFFHYFRL